MTLLYAEGFETCTADSDLRARGLLGTNNFLANIVNSTTGVAGSAVALAAQQNSALAPFQGAQGLVGYWSTLTVNNAWKAQKGFAFGLSITSNTSAANPASPTSANGIYACAVSGAAPANPAPLSVTYSPGSAAPLCVSTIASGFITAYLNTMANGGAASAAAQIQLASATHYYEFLYTPTATANVFNVAVLIDGVQKLAVSNVALAATNDTTSTLFFNLMPSNGTAQQVDDFYVIIQDGTGVQAPLSNVGGQAPHIIVRRPTTATQSQFTPNGPTGVNNVAAAAEPSLSAATTANEYLSTTAPVRDIYKSSATVPQSTIVGAITEAYIKSTNPATPFHLGIRSGNTHSDATPASLPSSWGLVQQITELDPLTGKRWLAPSLANSDLEVMSTSSTGSASNPNVVLLLAGSQSSPALSTGSVNPITDQSANNVPLTVNGPIAGSFSPYGSGWSGYFNGSSGIFYTAPSSTALSAGAQDYTFEFWHLAEVVPEAQLLQKGAGANSNYEWGLGFIGSAASPQLQYTYSANGTGYSTLNSSVLSVTPGAWNHYAVTCKSGTVTLWFNGNPVGTATGSPALYQGTGSLIIGTNGLSNSFANGFFSNIRFVIGKAMYTAAFTPSSGPLAAVAGTVFLSYNGPQWVDQSSLNLPVASIVGTPQVSRLCPFSVFNTQDAPNSTGYSLQMNPGSNPYIVGPGGNTYTAFSGAFTIECWYFPLSLGTQGLLYNWGSANASTSSIIITLNGSGGINSNYGSGGTNGGLLNSSNGKIIVGQWNHIALVRNAAGLVRWYINGMADPVTTTLTNTFNSSGANLCLFNYATGGTTAYNTPLNGYVCDFRIVNNQALYTGSTTYTMPAVPLTPIAGTTLLIGGEPSNLNLFDSAGNCAIQTGNTATISAAQPKFNGTSISIPTTTWSGPMLVSNQDNVFSFGTGDFTVETWWYLNALPSSAGFVIDARTASVTGGWCIGCGMISGNWLGWYTGGSGIQSTTLPPVGQWFHFAVVRHAGTMTQYLNGSPILTAADATNYVAGANLMIGARYQLGSSYPWSGYLAELRISLAAQYTSAFTPINSSFVGL